MTMESGGRETKSLLRDYMNAAGTEMEEILRPGRIKNIKGKARQSRWFYRLDGEHMRGLL